MPKLKKVRVKRGNLVLEGYLMPKHAFSSEDIVVIKLKNGYNVGLKADEVEFLEEVEIESSEKKGGAEEGEITLIGTGGTIASFVEYSTGAVKPAMRSEDFLNYAPELNEIAQIKPLMLFNVFSEDMKPHYWTKLAEKCAEEIRNGAKGVVIAHGTDTMHYTSSALAFAVQNLTSPIILVGAQRSSDRPSSDAHMNLLSAVRVAKSDLGEVCVVMHATTSDDKCAIHRGTRVRKMHTSARDAFRSLNSEVLGYVDREGKVEIFPHARKRAEGDIILREKFSEDAALVYYYPGASSEILDFFADKYHAIVIMGTGLGHVGEDWRKRIKDITKDGKYIFITSQCLYGTTNLNVYSSGRELLKNGAIPLGDMLPEVALVKAMWTLANYDYEEVGKIMVKNIVGEVSERRFSPWLR